MGTIKNDQAEFEFMNRLGFDQVVSLLGARGRAEQYKNGDSVIAIIDTNKAPSYRTKLAESLIGMAALPDLKGVDLLTTKPYSAGRMLGMEKIKIQAIEGQKTWKDEGLLTFKHEDSLKNKQPQLLEETGDIEKNAMLLMAALGIDKGDGVVNTPRGSVTLTSSLVKYINHKDGQSRGRFANYIIKTLESPFEIWRTNYTDGSVREHYIGLFEGRDNMYVVVWTDKTGKTFYNAFPIGAKKNYLNNKRMGIMIYKRK